MGKLQEIRNASYDAIRKSAERLDRLRSQTTDEPRSAFLALMSEGMTIIKQLAIEHAVQRETIAKELYEQYRHTTDDSVRDDIILALLELGVEADTIRAELGDVNFCADADFLVQQQEEGEGDLIDVFCGMMAEACSCYWIPEDEGGMKK